MLPAKFKQLERILGTADYFCGTSMTICDLSFYVLGTITTKKRQNRNYYATALINRRCSHVASVTAGTGLRDGTYCAGLDTGMLDGCPRLLALLERVGAHPRVVEWNARHC